MAKKVAELGAGFDNSVMFISHGDCREDAEALAELVKERCGVKECWNFLVISRIGFGIVAEKSTVCRSSSGI